MSETRSTEIYDWLDFDRRDEIDADAADSLRAVVFDLPERPGTRR